VSRAELLRALAVTAEPPVPALAEVAASLALPRLPTAAEHTDLFTFQLHPYASVHLGPEGQLGGIARDRVAGFLRALDVVPPAEPDHLVVLLAAYAQLVDLDEHGAGDRAHHARTVLLHEHLWPWVPGFAARAAELGAVPYRRWATLLDHTLAAEVDHLGPPPTLPAHLRDAPALPDPREAAPQAFLDGLLAPVRSGLVLARADLARIAHDLDLGLRIGERAYLLRALLAQDGPATLGALADEAARQRGQVLCDDLTARFRRDRLTATATLLGELATADGGVPVHG
jgi:TorA maturation chaperone TorD